MEKISKGDITKSRKKLTNEEYVNRITKIFNGNIVSLEDYVNRRTKIKHKCIKHNAEFLCYPASTLNGRNPCKICFSECCINNHKSNIDEIKAKIYSLYGTEYEVLDDHYIDYNHKMLFRHNLKNGISHNLISYPNRITNTKCGCPVCSGKNIEKGFNDIATIDKEIASWFLNKEETYIYGKYSNKKVDFKCPTCGHIVNKLINQVSRDRDIRCPICKDGISYPNKFIFNSLLHIKEKFDKLEREYRPSWCEFKYNGKIRHGIYDIYFEINSCKYIVEMDGGFHKKYNSMSGQSVNETKYLDFMKDTLAEKHGIKVIRIDCCYSGINDRFEYIYNNIFNSLLPSILPLDLIDFNEANIKSQKSLLVSTCELWDNGYKAGDISEMLNIPQCNVSVYLNIGQKYNLCHDYSQKKSNIRSSAKRVVCLNTNEVFDSISKAESFYKVDGIGKCCDGSAFSAGKKNKEHLFWMYYDIYKNKTKDDIESFIIEKNKFAMKENLHGRAVICVNTNKIFNSVMDASRYYSIQETGIRMCCKGKIKHSGKLQDGTKLFWMYYNEYLDGITS